MPTEEASLPMRADRKKSEEEPTREEAAIILDEEDEGDVGSQSDTSRRRRKDQDDASFSISRDRSRALVRKRAAKKIERIKAAHVSTKSAVLAPIVDEDEMQSKTSIDIPEVTIADRPQDEDFLDEIFSKQIENEMLLHSDGADIDGTKPFDVSTVARGRRGGNASRRDRGSRSSSRNRRPGRRRADIKPSAVTLRDEQSKDEGSGSRDGGIPLVSKSLFVFSQQSSTSGGDGGDQGEKQAEDAGSNRVRAFNSNAEEELDDEFILDGIFDLNGEDETNDRSNIAPASETSTSRGRRRRRGAGR